MTLTFLVILSVLVASCTTQSPYFRRPVGYPVLEPTSTTSTSTVSSDLGSRFGNGSTAMTTTTQRLPPEALGNRALVESLSKLPEDRQPFWLLNWRALEEHRKVPRTYEHRPSNFADRTSFVNARGSQNLVQRPQSFAQMPPNVPFFFK